MERRKVKRRVKVAKKEKEDDVEMADASTSAAVTQEAPPAAAVIPGDLPDEKEARKREVEELMALVDPTLKEDTGANVTGVYELCGAWNLLVTSDSDQ